MLVLGRKLSADEALSAGLVSTVLRADTEEEFLAKVSSNLSFTQGDFCKAKRKGLPTLIFGSLQSRYRALNEATLSV